MDRCRLLYAWSGASSALNVLHRINSIDTINPINAISYRLTYRKE